MELFDRQTIYGCVRSGRSRADAAILQGQPLTSEQKIWWREAAMILDVEKREAATLRRLKRAKEAQDKARARREAAAKAAKENLAGLMAGTAWPDGPRPALTATERSRASRERARDIGEIPPPRHPRLKERCRYDLEAFGWYYCRSILDHRASADIKNGLIADAQKCILFGGLVADYFGRGGGKTTWIDEIAPIWATFYGHRRFPFLVGSSLKAVKKTLKTIKRLIERSDELAADFPAIVLPVRAIRGIAQRAATLSYHGRAIDAEWGTDQITLPNLIDDAGHPLDVGCGAVIAVTGKGGAVRGANEVGQRPDFLLIDDPQTKKDAQSPRTVERIIEYIHSDLLGLAGHNATMSAFLTITPQNFGDVATAIAKRPEWSVTVQPFIKQTCPRWDELVAEFIEYYNEDAANHDFERSRSRKWYIANRAKFNLLKTIDPNQYDHKTEVDAVHHMLNLRAKMGEKSFNAEIMMDVSDKNTTIQITPDIVCRALNGTPRNVLPPGLDNAVAFCDVNTEKDAGLSWAIVAFGRRRTAAIINYGRYPGNNLALVPTGSSDSRRNNLIAAGIHHIITMLAGLKLKDSSGRPVELRALAFDRGFAPDVVHRSLYVNRQTLPLPFTLVAMRGASWKHYKTQKSKFTQTDSTGNVRPMPSQYGEYLSQLSAFWREMAQSGFLEAPLGAGSLSIFGRSPSEHYQFASEICAERLMRKYPVIDGGKITTAWDWQATGPNHYMDCVSGAFALASWFHCFDPLSSTIDRAALGLEAPAPANSDGQAQFDQTPAPLRASAPSREIKTPFPRRRTPKKIIWTRK